MVLQNILSNISWESQNDLVNSTVEHELNKKYPVNSSYQTLFLKKIIKILEEKNIEICDKIYENVAVKPSEFTYKHYFYENRAITLKESLSFVSEGTTGLCTWQASIALTNWFLQPKNQSRIKGKTIIELGAGTGLCALSLVKFADPKKIILTDGSYPVINNLKLNVDINFENRQNIETKLLCWENIAAVNFESVDYIIASDVVYDISIFKDLTNTILAIFQSSGNECTLFLASTIRNESTYGNFKAYLQNNGFAVKMCCTDENEKFLFWNTDTPIEILEVYIA